jgi:hypothetical protein
MYQSISHDHYLVLIELEIRFNDHLLRDIPSSRSLVIPNTQTNRAVRKISLPILRRLRVERQVRVRREVLRQVILDISISIITSQIRENSQHILLDEINEDQVNGLGLRAIRRESSVCREILRVGVERNRAVGSIIAIIAEIVFGNVARVQICVLTADDSAERALLRAVVVEDAWVDAVIAAGLERWVVESEVGCLERALGEEAAVVEDPDDLAGKLIWNVGKILEGVGERRDDEAIVESEGTFGKIEADSAGVLDDDSGVVCSGLVYGDFCNSFLE